MRSMQQCTIQLSLSWLSRCLSNHCQPNIETLDTYVHVPESKYWNAGRVRTCIGVVDELVYVQPVAAVAWSIAASSSSSFSNGSYSKSNPDHKFAQTNDAYRRTPITMRFVRQAGAFFCSVIILITLVFDAEISTNALDIKITTPMKSATEKFFILGSGSYTRKLILTNAGQSETICGLS